MQSPATGSQNRRYRDLSWQQRPHVPHLNPRKCPQIAGYLSETGKHRFASDCVVVDAVHREPVSASNFQSPPKFPDNRAINREFCRFRPSCTIFAPSRRANSVACSQIPYAMEQGIFGGLTGNSIEGSGKLVSVNFSHTCFGVCRTRSVLPSILQMRRTRWRTRS